MLFYLFFCGAVCMYLVKYVYNLAIYFIVFTLLEWYTIVPTVFGHVYPELPYGNYDWSDYKTWLAQRNQYEEIIQHYRCVYTSFT